MPINYTQSFQSGELSRKMDGRSDLDQYKTGCRNLNNFYVLPQGGVQRRTGTKFVNLTGDKDSINGANSARLFPFDFSDTAKYLIEIGTSYIKIFNGIAETDGSYTVYEPETGTVPAYTATELHELQAVRRYDTMVITHRNHEPLLLRRLTVTPTFSVSEIDYIYPPFMDMNLTATSLKPTSPAVGNTEIQTYSDNGTTEVADVINNDHVNSIWGINYVRSSANRKQDVNISDNTGVNGANEIDVSFSNFSIGLIGNLIGTVTVERKVGSGSYEDFVILGTSTSSSIFSFSSTVAEEANTQIRLKVEGYSGSGAMTGTIIAQERFSKGLTKIKDGSDILGASITAVAFGTNELELTCTHGLSTGDKVTIKGVKRSGSLINSDLVNLTVTDGAMGGGSTGSKFHVPLTGSYSTSDFTLDNAIIYSASRIDVENLSPLGGTTATIFWEEAAFSDYRKFPVAAEFYQNRLFFTGSKDEPATIFGSVFDDIFNFLTGSTSDMSIKRIPDTAAEAKSLTGKKDLFMGTDGGMVSIKSVNPDQLISSTNINTEIQNSYGSSLVQPVIANDVVVYLQSNKLKLRELVYSRDNDVFVGNDLNLLSEEITGTGIRQMFVQQNPNQIIWCIKEDGSACILSYDRAAGLMGWANIITTGTIQSGTVLTTSSEDDVWLVVKRGTKYVVEKFEKRDNLTWYVDSGKELNGGAGKSITDIAIALGKITITSTSHGLSNGNAIQINNTDSNQLNTITYEVSDVTTNTFKLKDVNQEESPPYIFYDNTNDIVVSGSNENSNFDGTYERKLNSNGDVFWQNKNFPSLKVESRVITTLSTSQSSFTWHLTGGVNGEISFTLGATQTSKTDLLKNLWWDVSYGDVTDTTKRAFRSATFKSEAKGEVIQVYNEISSLDHINGQTAQVLGNDSFIKETTITNNKITLDDYYNKIVVGLGFISTLQPMPIEPTLTGRLSQSRVKAVAKMVVRFLNTKGASVGEAGRQLTSFPVAKTTDKAGEVISLKTDSFRFFVGSDYEKEKLVEVKQDLPYPMTVLSITSNINVEGA